MNVYDVIIIGGGPAGLNAAVVLGRCRRKVLLFDHGKQRNRHSHGMHNYLTRDNMLPGDFLKISREEIKKYGVKTLHTEVNDAKKTSEEIFRIKDGNGKIYYSKKLVLATGLADILPAIKGAEEFYGKSLFHCPYCDAWEFSNKKMGVYSKSRNGIDIALALTTWSNDITLFTDGKKYVKPKAIKLLQEKNITIISQSIASLQGINGKIKNIVLKNGEKQRCDALFFSSGYEIQSCLVETLGCNLGKNKLALTNKTQQTNIPGLYVVGDAAKDMQFVVVAAAEGAKAGVYINKELLSEKINEAKND
ncbi:MAG: NAD(P)/FAD-dependent oxidoreductase [Ginsengibacter sp.]